jgi:twitching motility protein PilI
MAKRISLREFQRDLSQKLSSMQRGESTRSLLGVQSGSGDDAYWLIDLADSGEVIPLEALAPVPLTRPWFGGLTNVRGVLYSVIDFAAFRGLEPTPQNSDARLLMIGARHGINSSLLVNRTLGLRPLENLTREADDEAAPEWCRQRFVDAQGRRWTRLQVPALLSTPDFLDVAA